MEKIHDHMFLNNENGTMAMITVIMILAIITISVISLSDNSVTSMQVSTNILRTKLSLYAAESGWRDASYWLEVSPSPPNTVNTIVADDDGIDNDGNGLMDAADPTEVAAVVKTWGDGASTVLDTATINPDRTIGTIPYWYQVVYLTSGPAPGNAANFQTITYNINSSAEIPSSNDLQKTVGVNVSKVFKVGYNN